MRSPFHTKPRVVPVTDKGAVGVGESGDRSISTLFPSGDLQDLGPSKLSLHAALNECGALRTALATFDPNTRDPDGDRCPLHWAAARGHMKCALALLKAGADPRQIEVSSGMDCFELASSRCNDYLAAQLRRAAAPTERGSSTPTDDDLSSQSSRPPSEKRKRRPLTPEPFGEPSVYKPKPKPKPKPADRYLQPEPEPLGDRSRRNR